MPAERSYSLQTRPKWPKSGGTNNIGAPPAVISGGTRPPRPPGVYAYGDATVGVGGVYCVRKLFVPMGSPVHIHKRRNAVMGPQTKNEAITSPLTFDAEGWLYVG